MARGERIGGLFWLAVGVYVCVHSYSLGVGTPGAPGQGFIFFLAGAALGLLALSHLIGTFFAKAGGPSGEPSVWSGVEWRRILLVLLGAAAYLCLFDRLGFFLSTLLFMVLLFRIVERGRWWVTVLTALLTVSVTHAVFVRLLKIPFPRGPLGF